MASHDRDAPPEIARRRRRSVLGKRERRSVVVFLAASAVAAGLITLAAVLKRDPPQIMPPESPEQVALRTSPENAFPLIAEAVELLPPVPQPLFASEKDNAGFVGPYIPAMDSLGLFLKIGRPDDDPEFKAYLAAAAPAVEAMRRSLERPSFRLPSLYPAHMDVVRNTPALASLTMAAAIDRLRSGVSTDERATLLDVMRLGRLLDQDGGMQVHGSAAYVQAAALRMAWDVALGAATADQRIAQLAELSDLSLAEAPMKHHLELEWRVIDRRDAFWILAGNPEGVNEPSERVEDFLERLFVGRAMNHLRRHVLAHRALYEEAALLPLTSLHDFQAQHHELFSNNFYFDPMQGVMSAMNARATLDAWVRGWTVRAQLEQYKNDHGDYPSTLGDAGITEFDPFTGAPFIYRAYPGDVTLYSVGMNRGDNDADPIQDRDLVLHRATAEPELITPLFNQESLGLRRRR